jgi:hypothetical protein
MIPKQRRQLCEILSETQPDDFLHQASVLFSWQSPWLQTEGIMFLPVAWP